MICLHVSCEKNPSAHGGQHKLWAEKHPEIPEVAKSDNVANPIANQPYVYQK
jgi:hypothetical protein